MRPPPKARSPANRPHGKAVILIALLAGLAAIAGFAEPPEDAPRVRRTGNRSPGFRVPQADVAHFMNYTGFAFSNATRTVGERFHHEEIGPKVLDMIAAAERHIVFSVFLFDSFYANNPDQRDLVTPIVEAFLRQKQKHPDLSIAVILDPSHKAYGRRESPATKLFRENGIDVFYSDLLSDLNRASLLGVREVTGHANRILHRLTFNAWGNVGSAVLSRARVPKDFDGEPLSLETAYNAFLLKANHRKLLVADVHGGDYEAMVTSANPHSPSAYHVNSAVTVRGDPARYVYNLLREDMQHSAGLGRVHAHWHDRADRRYRKSFFTARFPALPYAGGTAEDGGAGITVVTEEEIPQAVIDLLDAVQPGDEVRIQMFYLSFQPVLDAILRAATLTKKPVRLLLDANKDSFNREKDGTPNRQVARYLLREAAARGGRLEVRWYSTHGEQNHAKTMSITNPDTGTHVLTTGSCNWTGRNMNGVNMESNVVVEDAPAVVQAFNARFDLFWSNSDGNEYSLPYEAFRDAATDWKWRRGEHPYYYSSF